MPVNTSGAGAALNARRRERDLDALAGDDEVVDVVIIGGGITGVGLALDAITRGLSTVLVEKHDLAFGTSRWSSKLAHGGLRYLAKMEFGIAHHSAVERGIIMERTAPHLVRALPQVMALGEDSSLVQKVATRVGFLAGDALRITAGTSAGTLPRSRYATKEETLRLCPAAARKNMRGSWVNYDGQMVDDARMVTAIARTAASEGARILTYCEATSASGSEVALRDRRGGRDLTVRARAVINATGVWAGGLDRDINVRPARGTHLVFRAETLGNPTGALTVPLPGSVSRYLFILPAPHGRCYLGLTDEDAPGEIPDVPPTPEEDVEFLLRNINRALDRKLTRSDVVGTFTGLRPLLDNGGEGSTADLSRRHAVVTSRDGMFSVVGGKFTEYRLMAEETLDRVIADRGLRAGGCATRNFPLIGAPGHRDYSHIAARDLHDVPEPMIRRFGNEAPWVIDAATVERPLDTVGPLDVTRAEVEYAFTHEGALTVEDVLERRTRAAMIPEDAQAMRLEVEEIRDHVISK
ncbi:glycerol-3-phosphate dehydrogenase/oxidase [Corynebacterium mastitidis]|uniref:Glycerol-3-phosphate dehydrogenase n=1 Tax=Corynebacterium mastitidis TaxID=161890 RepID=A0A2N0X879_9CORY|nr:glycerol-3-phosphate dehydrogenase/oxidase [Corynebacterium mastitidis]MCH6197077.1 glycerol-3-phosphate dehydrogenase/oxidase [Corynebacterium mastitidis]PKF68910.1 glycerol-3-phosphate dehydrogenase [Corynebacterium mastitidis]